MERDTSDREDPPSPGHCQVCGTKLSSVPVDFCPRCVGLQAALSLSDLHESNWEVILTRSFPHLRIRSAVGNTATQFMVERLEDGGRAILRVSRACEETEERQRQLRARTLLEQPGVLRLLEYGWLDGALYTVVEVRDGTSLLDLLSEGKLSRSQLLEIRARLEEIESEVSSLGYPLALRPEEVFISPEGWPLVSSLWRTDEVIDYTWLSKDDLSGSEIGRYKLERLIGEGGFAEVYLAQQTRPMQRQVALKILKSGMDTRQVIGRFETERDVLAVLDHPDIATVFDAGATPNGQPYFAMEYVDGLPLTDYVRRVKMPLEDRLRLFATLCRAVHHAHEKQIVHRDLKPSNVLVYEVDGKPRLKIIDFGIAKLLGGPLSEHTLYTELHQFVGSPGYMSPEQAELGATVDYHADIYALGAILYELIADSTPIPKARFEQLPHETKIRIVRESLTPLLTQRLRNSPTSIAEICEGMQMAPGALRRQLSRGLQDIVSVALARKPEDRYSDALNLALRVEEFLEGRYQKRSLLERVPPNILWPAVTIGIGIVLAVGLNHFGRVAEEAARVEALPPAIDPPLLLKTPEQPPLVWVEPGTLILGEGPTRREVTFHHPFAIGQFEVTQAEYHALMGSSSIGAAAGIDSKPSFFAGADPHAPVENVSWADATRYCAWLAAIEHERDFTTLPSGYTYSLPLEEEWEFAARQGKLSKRTTEVVEKFYQTPLSWFSHNSQVVYPGGVKLEDVLREGLSGTQPVGRSYPNRLGAYDILGNVSEWMHDFSATAEGPLVYDQMNGPSENGRGVVRGGSWAMSKAAVTESWRKEMPLNTRDRRIGFRVAAVHYESRHYLPDHDASRIDLGAEVNNPKLIDPAKVTNPVILDFETLPLGPVDPEHPLFQEIGIESIRVQSSDFQMTPDSRGSASQMLWSSKQNQLEIMTAAETGPFAKSLAYLISFKEPQQRVGFSLSRQADVVALEVGNDGRIDGALEFKTSRQQHYAVERKAPFKILRIATYLRPRRSKGWTIGLIDTPGFALDRLLLERKPSQAPIPEKSQTITSTSTLELSQGSSELDGLAVVDLSPSTLRQASSSAGDSAGGMGLRFEKETFNIPATLDLTATNAQWQEGPKEGGFTLSSATSGTTVQFTFSEGSIHRLSCQWKGLDLRPGKGFLKLYAEDADVPFAIYPLSDFQNLATPGKTAVHLHSSQPFKTGTFDLTSSTEEQVVLDHLAIGVGGPHEGWLVKAPHVPPAVILGGRLILVESRELLERCFPNQRNLSTIDYLQYPLLVRLPIGGYAIRLSDEGFTKPPHLVGTTLSGKLAFFPTDDSQLEGINRSVTQWSGDGGIFREALAMPAFSISSQLPLQFPQTFHWQGITVTAKRQASGQLQLRAHGRSDILARGSSFNVVAGLSRDGEQRDWDNLGQPLRLKLEEPVNQQPYWENIHAYPCDLPTDQPWCLVLAILPTTEPASAMTDIEDWKAWRAQLTNPQSMHVFKRF